MKSNRLKNSPDKNRSLEPFREYPQDATLTTDQGVQVEQTDDSLHGGSRGPTLLEDFHLREKIMRFDHERIPERVVHARGAAAHGVFQVYESLEDITRAQFLCDPSFTTPVFTRFSTVAGSRGSADTVRDVRGFATKFYTAEGNFDLVGNNMPVFFIQDAIKFLDFVHAVKPEPHNEIPQAASAHDTLWDFVSLQPETMHMMMWLMSDRALPRSFRMMEGFGVHTFRLVNRKGKACLCKFHWKPLLGVHSLVWDEAQKIAGKDPDFNRRDLWKAIEAGNFAEYELGLQVIDEKDELAFGFDLLDATKLLPEEVIPVRRVGKLTLNRNPQNFFAETEQVAFCIGNVVPGIDFTNDPLLQGRLFSYLDTQLTRLGGPNFAQIPINRPVAPVHNHQQDGFGQQVIPTGRAPYHPNSVGGGCPFLAAQGEGYTHYAERVDGNKIRARSDSFKDHYSQATMFLKSQSAPEREHLVEACQFELGKVERKEIRERVVEQFQNIDETFAREVAGGIGVAVPASRPPQSSRPEQSLPNGKRSLDSSAALSIANTPKDSIRTRCVAVLAADGVRAADITQLKAALAREGARMEVIAKTLGLIESDDKSAIEADKSHLTAASVFYDAVFVPGGDASATAMTKQGDAIHFVQEAFRHCKTLGAGGEGIQLVAAANLPGIDLAGEATKSKVVSHKGVVTSRADIKTLVREFIEAMKQHRHFDRADKQVPA
ncbi:MAG: catalase [Pseudomonadota bacterium]|nr:catalase [Pseudomonadota bacterium]